MKEWAANAAERFTEISGLITPGRVLNNPAANGAFVRIAVVDTGIDRAALESRYAKKGITIKPIEGATFTATEPAPKVYNGQHSSPHGTTVADIILSLAPVATLFSADVFGPLGSCEVETLARALRWAVDEWKCNLINLSLGIPESQLQSLPRRQRLSRAIEHAYFNDVLVVAAAHNEHPLTRSYPAAFAPPLISVKKGDFSKPAEFSYELDGGVEFSAHAKGYFGPFVDEPATSWAAPHITGIAARILSVQPKLKPFELKTILYWLSKNRS